MAQQAITVSLNRVFLKNYQKRIASNTVLVKKFSSRYKLFLKDRSNPILRDHKLSGTLKGYRSFSITGDIRVLYEQIGSHFIEFYDIGTHNQVYR